ncbi:MAG TPA: cupin domain-containing protein [Burkholderiales bacterium]|nr:cupin domain-containing protein [Burkholderiales bacterium]
MNRKTFAVLAVAAGLAAGASFADEHKHDGGGVKVTPKLAVDLADLPGKEGMMLTVEFPPGHVSEAHRHEAHTFVYVLEGSIDMQVAGGELKHLRAGDTFYENPTDIHTVATNTSKTKPAKILVVFVKNKGAPPVMPAR